MSEARIQTRLNRPRIVSVGVQWHAANRTVPRRSRCSSRPLTR